MPENTVEPTACAWASLAAMQAARNRIATTADLRREAWPIP
jgi:hypothetical protein